MGLISLLNNNPEIFFILIITLLFSLSLHEFAHGYVAYKCGDLTAYNQGRLTLNPMAHLDPIGSLMILFIGFGWAKPVPVNGANLRNPRADMIKVAIAGPASNLLLAIIAGIIFKILSSVNPEFLVNSLINKPTFLGLFLYLFCYYNIVLCVFNMIPIPPLDGSRLLNFETQYKLQRYGPLFLFGVMIFSSFSGISIIGKIINPFISIFENIFFT